jgi:hypothetical protein
MKRKLPEDQRHASKGACLLVDPSQQINIQILIQGPAVFNCPADAIASSHPLLPPAFVYTKATREGLRRREVRAEVTFVLAQQGTLLNDSKTSTL